MQSLAKPYVWKEGGGKKKTKERNREKERERRREGGERKERSFTAVQLPEFLESIFLIRFLLHSMQVQAFDVINV